MGRPQSRRPVVVVVEEEDLIHDKREDDDDGAHAVFNAPMEKRKTPETEKSKENLSPEYVDD